MKNLFFLLIIFLSVAQVSAQIEINSSGQVGVGTTNPQHQLDVSGNARVTGNLYLGTGESNFLGTTSDIPIIFKVNNVMAGFTGAGFTGHRFYTNVSFGYGSLNPFVGNHAFGSCNNVAIGVGALYSNTTGSSNVANGYQALYSNTEGHNNIAIGNQALYSHSGVYNIAIGNWSLYSNIGGINNVAIGFQTLYSNTTGRHNVAIGDQALYLNTTGDNNVVSGFQALYSNTSGHNNIANGLQALCSNTTGAYNIASGIRALRNNTIGNNNIAIGYHALSSNTTGDHNISFGNESLNQNSTGNFNIANGGGALGFNNSGNHNVAIGIQSLLYNSTGSYNTAIGYRTNYQNVNLNNTTAIGYEATVIASNSVAIGNNAVTSIGGYVAWTNISDGRTKKNIRSEVPGLSFIKLLKPITYNLDLDAVDELLKSDDPKINERMDSLRRERSPEEKAIRAKAKADKEKQVYSGFIAQDVEKAAHSVGYNFSGVDAPENDRGAYGLRYSEFVVPLVKAVQELSEQNDRLQRQVNELTTMVNRLMSTGQKDTTP